MTVSLILNIVRWTAVFAGVLGLLLSSIATQCHSLPRAEIHTLRAGRAVRRATRHSHDSCRDRDHVGGGLPPDEVLAVDRFPGDAGSVEAGLERADHALRPADKDR